MNHATTKTLETWEMYLNELFSDFYDMLYDISVDSERCYESIAEIRGFATALYFTHTISKSESHLIHVELRTMIALVFKIKIKVVG